MNRFGRRAYVGFIALSLALGGTWAAVGTSRRSPEPARTVAPVFASAAAIAAAQSVHASASDPMQPPDLVAAHHATARRRVPRRRRRTEPRARSTKIQWDSTKTPCVKEDSTLVDPGVSDLAGAALEGHLPPGWPKSANCVYLGGFGLGPSRPATGVDPYAGVKVRSIAISNGMDTVVWQSLDMVGLFSRYRADLCPEGCGMLDIREAIASATFDKVPMANIAINATHTHGGADGYGAWGGLPAWYRVQIRDRAIQSAYDALRDLTPTSIRVGSIEARPFNNERRDTYYSAADYGAVWLQARQLPARGSSGAAPVVATLVNFGAHPTVVGDENSLMHPDWAGTAAKELGTELGGAGIVMQGALGNVSPSTLRHAAVDLTGDRKTDDKDNAIQMARDFASFIGADIARGGYVLKSNRITTKTITIAHPAGNWVETVGALANLLDREFAVPSKGANGPSTYTWRKSEEAPPLGTCVSAGAVSVKTDVSAFRIGELTVTTAPGELFGTMADVVKSKSRANGWAVGNDGKVTPTGQTMVFGQTQDTLGYIIQHFEVDPAGGVTSNTDPSLGEYEEELMVDRCFGDHVLQTQLDLLRQLN